MISESDISKVIESGNPGEARKLLVCPETPQKHIQRLAEIIQASGDPMHNAWCALGLAFGRDEIFPGELDRAPFIKTVIRSGKPEYAWSLLVSPFIPDGYAPGLAKVILDSGDPLYLSRYAKQQTFGDERFPGNLGGTRPNKIKYEERHHLWDPDKKSFVEWEGSPCAWPYYSLLGEAIGVFNPRHITGEGFEFLGEKIIGKLDMLKTQVPFRGRTYVADFYPEFFMGKPLPTKLMVLKK